MGGAKVDDKVALIETLLKESDYILVGGGIANTFLKSVGYNIGTSLYSEEYVDRIRTLISEYREKIIMPIDVVVKERENISVKSVASVPTDAAIYDIGDKTIEKYKEYIQKSETIFVNGTMGLYEDEQFRQGTEHLYQELSHVNSVKIAGGGDAVASINKLSYADVFDFLSTGGGATLEYIVEKKINCFGEE